ncbi:MAG: hypothetical protein KF770_17190 [Anaerolineae bacterium]|nr:hypothetical protein [Anaerolineae bacterium]
MKHIQIYKLWPFGIAAIIAFAFLFVGGGNKASNGATYALVVPSFVGVANAAPANAATEIIEDEAGMSAYFEATTPVTIDSVRPVYQTIELETSEYILGSVALAGYPEDHAPHVYVHVDGWFLAYYSNGDPVAKIIDWNAYTASGDTIISTKLENVLAIVAGSAGVGIPGITHYDFRFPNATNMMLIAERSQGAGNDYFTVNIPTSFGVSERSWSIHLPGSSAGSISLNGTTLYSGGGDHVFGTLSASQMPPATTHTIVIGNDANDVGGISLVYTE